MRKSFHPEGRLIAPMVEQDHGLEGDGLYSYPRNVRNPYFHHQHTPRRGPEVGMGIMNYDVQFVPNPNFVGAMNTCDNGSRAVHNQNQQSIPPNYCHLSYYGEEIDKEYLPETMSSFGSTYTVERNFEGSSENRQRNSEDGFEITQNQHVKKPFRFLPSASKVYPETQHPLMSSCSSESTGTEKSFRETEKFRNRNGYYHTNYGQRDTQRQQFQHNNNNNYNVGHQPHGTSSKSPFTRMDTAENDNFHEMVTNNKSSSGSVDSFQTAASQFQEKQARHIEMEEASATAFQGYGWSRSDSNVSTKRKVTLPLDNDNHATKLQKRLSRFGEHTGFKETTRGYSEKTSLEQVISKKNGNRVETWHGGNNSMATSRITPSTRPWLSGRGEIVCNNTGRTFQRENVQGLRRNKPQNQSATEHFNHQSNQTPRYCQQPHQSGHPGHAFNKPFKSYKFRPVVIDGSNVAFAYGEELHFDCEGIRVCVDYFMQLGCDDITVVVPSDRLKRGASKDVHILQDLKNRNMLLANWGGQFDSNGDNRGDRLFILDLAYKKGGIIVSNLRFTDDIVRYNPAVRPYIWNSVLNFRFNSATPKEIIFPGVDESGKYGSTWEDIFRMGCRF